MWPKKNTKKTNWDEGAGGGGGGGENTHILNPATNNNSILFLLTIFVNIHTTYQTDIANYGRQTELERIEWSDESSHSHPWSLVSIIFCIWNLLRSSSMKENCKLNINQIRKNNFTYKYNFLHDFQLTNDRKNWGGDLGYTQNACKIKQKYVAWINKNFHVFKGHRTFTVLKVCQQGKRSKMIRLYFEDFGSFFIRN